MAMAVPIDPNLKTVRPSIRALAGPTTSPVMGRDLNVAYGTPSDVAIPPSQAFPPVPALPKPASPDRNVGGGSGNPVPVGPDIMPVPPAPTPPPLVDPGSANAAALSRARDQIGVNSRASIDALRNEFAGRNLQGSNIEAAKIGDIVMAGQGQMADTLREQAIQEAARAQAVEDRNYAGGLTTRGQDVTSRGQDVGQAIATAGNVVATRGQDVSAQTAAAAQAGETTRQTAAEQAQAARDAQAVKDAQAAREWEAENARQLRLEQTTTQTRAQEQAQQAEDNRVAQAQRDAINAAALARDNALNQAARDAQQAADLARARGTRLPYGTGLAGTPRFGPARLG